MESKDLCDIEPGYHSPKEIIHIFVTYGDLVSTFWQAWLSQTLQFCGSGLNRPQNENEKNKTKI